MIWVYPHAGWRIRYVQTRREGPAVYPALAGEPDLISNACPSISVYPRARRRNPDMVPPITSQAGLSPRTQGGMIKSKAQA
jgi:hypothetical protein